MGYNENSKTYKLYNLIIEKIIISRDIIFVGEKLFKLIVDVGKFIPIDLIDENNEDVDKQIVKEPTMIPFPKYRFFKPINYRKIFNTTIHINSYNF